MSVYLSASFFSHSLPSGLHFVHPNSNKYNSVIFVDFKSKAIRTPEFKSQNYFIDWSSIKEKNILYLVGLFFFFI